MKRFSKFFSGIAAIMLGVGILLIAIGAGSAKSDWEEIAGAQQGTNTIERTFEAEKDVELAVSLGVIRVEASWDEEIHFQARNVRAEAVEITEKAGEIQIRMGGDNWAATRLISIPLLLDEDLRWDFSDGFSYDVYEDAAYPVYVLFVPEDYAGKLELSLDVGAVSVQEITAGELKASVDVGELRIHSCTAKRLSAECDMGANIVSGAYGDIIVENDIGTVDVRIVGREEDYNGDLACELGKVRYMRGSVPAGAGKLSEEIELAEYFDVSGKGGVDRSFEWYGASAKGQLKVRCDIGEIEVRLIEP